MIKRVDSGSYWSIYDNKRNTANPRTKFFKVNESAAEATDTNSYSVDFLTNGFKIKGDGSNINNNSATYLSVVNHRSLTPPNRAYQTHIQTLRLQL